MYSALSRTFLMSTPPAPASASSKPDGAISRASSPVSAEGGTTMILGLIKHSSVGIFLPDSSLGVIRTPATGAGLQGGIPIVAFILNHGNRPTRLPETLFPR